MQLDIFFAPIIFKAVKVDKHNLACKICTDNIVFEENCLGLESIEISIGANPKNAGLLCSVCASSSAFKHLNFEKDRPRISKVFKSREFLRYFVGVLPDKYKEGQ